MQSDEPEVKYCLYARKSSEQDERQAMSIDSQIKEMSDLAQNAGITVADIRKESHSAKISGKRPVFNKLIEDISQEAFNGILTWAPDRLSRNAGDLGMLVDLMDQGKLHSIKTPSQTFSSNPNDKFMLMILCSQAKLENDQKGLNVKRGIRAKCEMGWRPGVAPLGYYNRAFAGTKDIIIDPERGPLVTDMFNRVVNEKVSGRIIKKWFIEKGFTNRSGTQVSLSQIYLMLKNPFYYGEFEYPIGSGNWYQGKHEPLITKELFDKAQKQLEVPKKSKWGAKKFTYKGIFKCASCKASIVGEERHRKRLNKPPRRHVYYHCSRQVDYDCKEGYITEQKLEKQMLRFINFMYIAHRHKFDIPENVIADMQNYKNMRDQVLLRQDINPDAKPWDIRDYAQHIFYNGAPTQKRQLFQLFDYQLYIQNRMVTTLRAH